MDRVPPVIENEVGRALFEDIRMGYKGTRAKAVAATFLFIRNALAKLFFLEEKFFSHAHRSLADTKKRYASPQGFTSKAARGLFVRMAISPIIPYHEIHIGFPRLGATDGKEGSWQRSYL